MQMTIKKVSMVEKLKNIFEGVKDNVIHRSKNISNKVKNFDTKVLTMFMGAKVNERKKSKGALNTVEVLAIVVVLLVITYPLYKGLVTEFLNSAKTWFETQQSGIFK